MKLCAGARTASQCPPVTVLALMSAAGVMPVYGWRRRKTSTGHLESESLKYFLKSIEEMTDILTASFLLAGEKMDLMLPITSNINMA